MRKPVDRLERGDVLRVVRNVPFMSAGSLVVVEKPARAGGLLDVLPCSALALGKRVSVRGMFYRDGQHFKRVGRLKPQVIADLLGD